MQRIKGNQIQKQIREEMDVLADQVTSLNAHRETQTQLVKKLEEREKALQNAVVRESRWIFSDSFICSGREFNWRNDNGIDKIDWIRKDNRAARAARI